MSDTALRLAEDRPSSVNDDLYQWAIDAEEELRRLHAENEALRADADRYRWLRCNSTEYSITQKDGYGGRELKGWEELDTAIDVARSKT